MANKYKDCSKYSTKNCDKCDKEECDEYSKTELEYIRNTVIPMQKRSKIWQLLRNRKDIYSIDWSIEKPENTLILNGGMMCSSFDNPYAYMCTVFGYEITQYSCTKEIEVYKKKWVRDTSVNLHYYYYISDNLNNGKSLFYNECIEPITQETLASIANRNWSKTPNFIKTEANKLFLKQMKIKYIKCLEYYKQIIFDEQKQKYISYDFYMFVKNEEYKK
jgi:hypothetical protein